MVSGCFVRVYVFLCFVLSMVRFGIFSFLYTCEHLILKSVKVISHTKFLVEQTQRHHNCNLLKKHPKNKKLQNFACLKPLLPLPPRCINTAEQNRNGAPVHIFENPTFHLLIPPKTARLFDFHRRNNPYFQDFRLHIRRPLMPQNTQKHCHSLLSTLVPILYAFRFSLAPIFASCRLKSSVHR